MQLSHTQDIIIIRLRQKKKTTTAVANDADRVRKLATNTTITIKLDCPEASRFNDPQRRRSSLFLTHTHAQEAFEWKN